VNVADLASLDRDVARAFGAWQRWRERLAEDPDAHADHDPIEPYRHVAGQSTWKALGDLEVVSHDAPLRDALKRWVHALLQSRLARELDVAWARAANEARGRFTGESPRLVSWREARRAMIAAEPREARLWLDALVECAPPIAAIARERAARRVEIARRLGAETFDATPLDALHAAARDLLARTDDLASSLLREARATDATDAIALSLARDAGEGWPARLSSRWLEELFGGGVRGLDVALPRLPEALGASSFARALGAFGFALRVAAGARAPRFALAREPAFVAAHRFAFVFAALPTSPDFHRVALGVGKRAALAQARALARSALVDARLHAVRLLSSDDRAQSDAFEELTARVFGAPLPRALAGALPAPRDDEPARFLALATALPLARDLVERFDVDWFANPRAMPHLRALGAHPAREESPPPDVAPLARVFEEALA